ncbi:MAG: FIST C-terminal domain-containing protein [Desulfovibrio sp.]|nr:FIST C-terminal domain-containing protein [Desulfovibrio sp.]
MIEMHTASTVEIDEIDDAVKEILDQLPLGALKKNSVGILYCCMDFVETGVVGALDKALPFSVLGMTTMASADRNNLGMYNLTLTVLTSDDVLFETVVTGPLFSTDYKEKIAATYKRARAGLPGDPACILSFIPYTPDISGTELTVSLDATSGGIPVWGGVTVSLDVYNGPCCTILEGRAQERVLGMILVYGSVNPEFIVASIPEENIFYEKRAIITSSENCILRTVNDMPVLQFFESIGMTIRPESSATLPFMVDYKDGSTPVVLGISSVLEDGSVLCGGPVPQGALIAMCELTREGILATTRQSVEKILQLDKNALLMMPCVIRYVMMAPQNDEEMRLVADTLAGKMPYVMAYCGGEICPVRDGNGRWRNRFHHYTFTACVL